MDKHKTGFTIIETVLVLAVAGLIIVGAFIALPALWASQRDSAREANVMKFISGIKSYQANSRGALPADTYTNTDIWFRISDLRRSSSYKDNTWEYLIKNYVDEKQDFSDPTVGDTSAIYILKCQKSTASLAIGATCNNNGGTGADFARINENNDYVGEANGNIYIIIDADCNGNMAVKSSKNQSVAVVQVLERGNAAYCANT